MPEQGAFAAKRGHNAGGQPEKKREKKITFPCFLLCVGRHTKSIVESHKRSVLRQCKLRRGEIEASGEKKRESDHCCNFECDLFVFCLLRTLASVLAPIFHSINHNPPNV
jgi:hypothetical protein